MLFENINFLLRQRGAPELTGEEFLSLNPESTWEIVKELGYPFEVINTVDLRKRHEEVKPGIIKLVILDVDGVLTDGGLIYGSSGEDSKKFNVKDGMLIKKAIDAGFEFGIISASSRPEVIKKRAEVLGIQNVYVGHQPKIEVLESWLYTKGLGFENVAYIGDDLNDVQILSKVGLSATPFDGAKEAKYAAQFILNNRGGRGCVREFIENYLLF